ncbi:MAG: BTAD domain-containing putative transcriptional regulator [Gemmatimonadota bacterium]|nr:BTAD domain-containing putative transcriptional regulator [Gemmatimonadota bacterium]
MFELITLGSVEVREDRGGSVRPVSVPPKPLAVLVYLAVERSSRRDTLLGVFWPDLSERRARTALRKTLHRIRKALDSDALVTDGETVRVDPGRLGCDAAAFEAAVEEGDHETALALYDGPFLKGFHVSDAVEFEHWADRRRTDLEKRAREAVALLVEELADEDPALAARWARRGLAIDPLDEAALRRYVRLLDRAGDRAGAVRAYGRFAEELERELGVEPAPETRALIEEVRGRDEASAEALAAWVEVEDDVEEPAAGLDPDQDDESSVETGRGGRAMVAVAAAVILAVGAWWALEVRSGGSTAVAEETPSEVVAVLPFETAGAAPELWKEGMMDLLATNLHGIEGLRPVDPQAVVTVWNRAGAPRDAADENVARTARSLGARWAVVGSVADLGDRLRLSAEILDTADGRRLEPIVVDGPADSLYALVDRLTVGMLDAGVLPADRHLPPVDLRRVTTRSLPALKAYLTGEKAFRRARWEEAIQAFKDAVVADSTFALAYYKLAVAHDRIGPRQRAVDFARRAARHADRLPAREALLVRARAAMARGEVESLDLYQELLSLDPEWEYGWFGLGEALVFVGPQRLHPLSDFRDALHRAIEINPYFAPAYNKLVEDAFAREDRADAERLIAGLARIDDGSPTCVGYRTARDLAWGTTAEKARRIAALDTMSAAPYKPLSCAGSALHLAPVYDEAMEPVTAARTHPRHPVDHRKRARWPVFLQRLEGGRIDEAEEILDSYAAEPRSALMAAQVDLELRMAGYPVDRSLERTLAVLEADGSPRAQFTLGMWAAHRGDRDALARRAEEIRSFATDTTYVTDGRVPEDVRIHAATLEALGGLILGDPGSASRLQSILPEIRGPYTDIALPMIVNYYLGDWFLEREDPDRARIHLEALDNHSTFYLPLADLRLGKAYDALGQPLKARDHFARVARWLEKADPDVQPIREEALVEMARLRRE